MPIIERLSGQRLLSKAQALEATERESPDRSTGQYLEFSGGVARSDSGSH